MDLEAETSFHSSHNAVYSQHPIPPESDGIRVVVLHEATEEEDDISCNLLVVSLNRPPLYEALSYTWGPPFEGQHLEDRSITLNGAIVPVTGNLWHALYRLRHRTTPRCLWIDALCINQHDVSERSQQVAIMARIYKRARRTLVWLGEDSGTFDGASSFDAINRLAQWSEAGLALAVVKATMLQSESRHVHDGRVLSNLLSTSKQDGQVEAGASDTNVAEGETFPRQQLFDSIRRLFSRRYFKRLWVVQEMYHAKAAILHCGCHRIAWNTFLRGVGHLRRVGTQALAKGLGAVDTLLLLNGSIVERLDRLMQLSRSPDWLLKCIVACEGAGCADPRDRIFALSSLGSEELLKPDYTLSLTEVYLRFARCFVEKGLSQSLLFNAAVQNATPAKRAKRQALHPPVPSWVIDWRPVDAQGEVTKSLWHDNGPKWEHGVSRAHLPTGGLDPYQNGLTACYEATASPHGVLECILPVLAVIGFTDGEPAELKLEYAVACDVGDTYDEVLQSFQKIVREHGDQGLRPGDVICRLAQFYDWWWGFLILRQDDNDKDFYIVAPLFSSKLVTNALLQSVPPALQPATCWRRFRIL